MSKRLINRVSNITAKNCIEILEICSTELKTILIEYKTTKDKELKKVLAIELKIYNDASVTATNIMKADSEMSLKQSQERMTDLNADQVAKELINGKKQDKKITINVMQDK